MNEDVVQSIKLAFILLSTCNEQCSMNINSYVGAHFPFVRCQQQQKMIYTNHIIYNLIVAIMIYTFIGTILNDIGDDERPNILLKVVLLVYETQQ